MRRLETSAATGTPCKRESPKASIRKTVIPKTVKIKESGADTEVSCIAEMDESTRRRIDFSTNGIHKGHIAGKGQNSEVSHKMMGS